MMMSIFDAVGLGQIVLSLANQPGAARLERQSSRSACGSNRKLVAQIEFTESTPDGY